MKPKYLFNMKSVYMLKKVIDLYECYIGCLIMNATKVVSNNIFTKAPYELKVVP